MHVLTEHLWNRQLRRARPHVNDGQIVGKRHCELVDRWLRLARGRELREIPTHHRGTVEHFRRIGDLLLELHTRRRQSLAVRRNTRAEPASLRERGGGRTWRGEAPRLENASIFLREALRPSSSYGCVIVDEYVGAVIDGRALEEGLDQHEGFAILVARGIGDLIV